MNLPNFFTGLVLVVFSSWAILRKHGLVKGRFAPFMLLAGTPKKIRDKVDNTPVDKAYVTIVSIIIFIVGLLFLIASFYY